MVLSLSFSSFAHALNYAINTICLNKVLGCVTKTIFKAKVLEFKYNEIINPLFHSVMCDTAKNVFHCSRFFLPLQRSENISDWQHISTKL